MKLRELENHRVTLTGSESGQVLCGWVACCYGENVLEIEITQPSSPVNDEPYQARISYLDGHARFGVVKIDGTKRRTRFQIVGGIHLTAVSEDPRMRVQMKELLITEDEDFMVEVVDVSPNGMGVILPKELKQGEPVAMQMTYCHPPLVLEGTIRYCKPRGDDSTYRAGILLQFDRLQRARWRMFIHNSAVLFSRRAS